VSEYKQPQHLADLKGLLSQMSQNNEKSSKCICPNCGTEHYVILKEADAG
jgi:hypothetical protein